MSKTKICDCDGPHRIATGTVVHLADDPKDYTVANLCTRGKSARDYTQLAYFLIDPDMVGGDQWPGTFVHHSKILVTGGSAGAPSH